MDRVLLIATIVYVVVGALVYFVTDTKTLASQIESATPLPWGVVQRSIFLLVVALWPLWLLFKRRPEDLPPR
jgi:hypothetical protein